MNYTYPIDTSWTMEELLAVMALLQMVEKAYEGGVASSEAMAVYREYKNLGFSISDEKQLNRDFEEASNYSLYQLLQALKSGEKFIKLMVGK